MIRRKMLLISAILLTLVLTRVTAIGVSTAAFIPREGSLSHPVSPLSLRDIGISMGNYVGVSTSLSLYNINGMGITDSNGSPLAFSTPPIGPFYTLLSSFGIQFSIPISRITIEPLAGVFGYLLINPDLRSGSVDGYIAREFGHTTVDSSFSVNGKSGWGYIFGGSLTLMLSGTIGVQAGALYYIGGSALELSGSYIADGSAAENPVPTVLETAEMDFTGLEISIGITYEL